MSDAPSAAVTMCHTFLDEWCRLGLLNVVVSPGSRSTPMALALTKRNDLRVDVFHDERSAAFAAVGAAIGGGRPSLLLCTSGTAAAEFFPAIAEASQGCVPMIVCTADRPPELQGIGAPQTMDQQHLYGSFVRRFDNVHPPKFADRGNWRKIARSAWHDAKSTNPGPVHLNLQFREPLVGDCAELPPVEVVPHVTISEDVDMKSIEEVLQFTRGVIVAGNGVDDPRAVVALGERIAWPVIADPRSGCRSLPGVVTFADSLLRNEATAEALRPEAVLRLGEPPASKVVNRWLARSGAKVVAVSPSSREIDPEGIVRRHLVAPISHVANAVGVKRVDLAWSNLWRTMQERAARAISQKMGESEELSEPWIARTVAEMTGNDDVLFVSSSMPIRDVEWFAARCPRTVIANRGVNGIDGVMSTGLGVALGSSRVVNVLVGDVAFLHDSNVLINLSDRRVRFRVFVIDNAGGGIFSFLDQAGVMDKASFERFFGTPHRSDLVALALAHGVPAAEVSSRSELEREILHGESKVVVMKTNRERNVEVHDLLNQAVARALDVGA